jgi:hypothetical protein
MSKRRNAILGALACLIACAATLLATAQESAASPQPTATAPAPKLHYSNRWRLQVSEGADNDGVMTFRFTPKDGAPVDIPVHLKKGRGEDGCARDIRDAFRMALDKKAYKIEVDDGEDVLVKKHLGHAPDFSIELVSSTVMGTRVNFDRE